MRDSRLMSPWDAAQAPPSALVARVRGEFLEMLGLRLTLAQAARLWGLSEAMTRALLHTLVEARFLVRHDNGSYSRWPN